MIIVKLGGSVIQHTLLEINPQLKEILDIIKQSKERVGLVNGGGPFSRLLQNSLREFGVEDKERLGKVGYLADNLFGEFLILNLENELTFPGLVTEDFFLKSNPDVYKGYKYIIGGASGTGHSSDFNAVVMAMNFNSKNIIRITNIDYVYDQDPKKFPNAQKIEKLDWEMYLSLIGKEFIPGGNYPFDPIASNLAMQNGVKVYLCNLENFLTRSTLGLEDFVGTVIG